MVALLSKVLWQRQPPQSQPTLWQRQPPQSQQTLCLGLPFRFGSHAPPIRTGLRQGESNIWRVCGTGSAAPRLARQWYNLYLSIIYLPVNLLSIVSMYHYHILDILDIVTLRHSPASIRDSSTYTPYSLLGPDCRQASPVLCRFVKFSQTKQKHPALRCIRHLEIHPCPRNCPR